jgi:hypothetical protein
MQDPSFQDRLVFLARKRSVRGPEPIRLKVFLFLRRHSVPGNTLMRKWDNHLPGFQLRIKASPVNCGTNTVYTQNIRPCLPLNKSRPFSVLYLPAYSRKANAGPPQTLFQVRKLSRKPRRYPHGINSVLPNGNLALG